MFGDTSTDMKYARSIGAGAAYAAYGYGIAKDCLSYKPNFIVDAMPSLLQAFR